MVSHRGILSSLKMINFYRAFHGFGQDKFGFGGLVFGWSQFDILPQL
jgi:hypothetical protein